MPGSLLWLCLLLRLLRLLLLLLLLLAELPLLCSREMRLLVLLPIPGRSGAKMLFLLLLCDADVEFSVFRRQTLSTETFGVASWVILVLPVDASEPLLPPPHVKFAPPLNGRHVPSLVMP